MIAVALAVIAGVVAVTCGIVADSNHADSLAFLGVMVKTTAAQIFLTGALCTWALFAALWLLSVGLRRSRQRTLELRALRTDAHFAYTDVLDATTLTAPGELPPLTPQPPYAPNPQTAYRALQPPSYPAAPESRYRATSDARPAALTATPTSIPTAPPPASIPPIAPTSPTFLAVPPFPTGAPPATAPPQFLTAPATTPATPLPPLPGDEPTLTEDGFADNGPNPAHWPHGGH